MKNKPKGPQRIEKDKCTKRQKNPNKGGKIDMNNIKNKREKQKKN